MFEGADLIFLAAAKIFMLMLVVTALYFVMAINYRRSNTKYWFKYKLFRKKIPNNIVEECYNIISNKQKDVDFVKQKLIKGDIIQKQIREYLYIFNIVQNKIDKTGG